MVRLGFKPWAEGWKALTNPLGYCGPLYSLFSSQYLKLVIPIILFIPITNYTLNTNYQLYSSYQLPIILFIPITYTRHTNYLYSSYQLPILVIPITYILHTNYLYSSYQLYCLSHAFFSYFYPKSYRNDTYSLILLWHTFSVIHLTPLVCPTWKFVSYWDNCLKTICSLTLIRKASKCR